MERRDQELLDKQLRHVQIAPRTDGVIMPVLLAVFFTGMALGGFFVCLCGRADAVGAATRGAEPAGRLERSADLRAARDQAAIRHEAAIKRQAAIKPPAESRRAYSSGSVVKNSG